MSLKATLRKFSIVGLIVWLSLLSPAIAFGQAVDATGSPTGAPVDTGAPPCTGPSCDQGVGQGVGQGADQGFNQGTNQGVNQGNTDVTAQNSDTGANSNNQANVNAANNNTTNVNNQGTSNTNGAATATTGGNASNSNTGAGGVQTGAAGIGVAQVVNDNSTGASGLSVSGHNGDLNGDLNIGFGSNTASLANGASVQATNSTTGSGSTNGVDVNTQTQNLTEVQNDGRINNLLNLGAITGQNQSSMNTGGGSIQTGDANVAATLVNLLNTTVVNGGLWVTVADIFGNLTGNINLPDLAQLAQALGATSSTTVDASNNHTGNNSDNAIAVDASEHNTTNVHNDADITTTLNANAVTGQNSTLANTGGGNVQTGNASASASNISVANTTIEGGNWGLVIVNALNRWLGFLVGQNGEVRALSQEETLREIAAQNTQTGADSSNTITVNDSQNDTTNVHNDAVITNEVNASAITGENQANYNTEAGSVRTGEARIQATAVNLANTTVHNGSLFIAVVNIFGDWLGDLLYKGNALAAAGNGGQVTISADNTNTGADSTNTIDVDASRHNETNVDNHARTRTTLNANVDTGNNHVNRNTSGGDIQTGDAFLALHAGTLANLTAIAGLGDRSLTITGANDTTGANSINRIHARLNDEQIINVTNTADVNTLFSALVNTGLNEANQNTVGGNITTGGARGDVGIHNLINQVLLALGQGGGTVDATLLNRLTGALSTNTNDVDATRQLLINILNTANVTNLMNLLFNTGGNTAQENTEGGSISTGEICVNGNVSNQVNTATLPWAGTTNLTNGGNVQNATNVTGTTGNNTLARNTSGQHTPQSNPCEKVAGPVEQPPQPTPGVGGGEEVAAAGGGGEEEHAPTVAGAITKKLPHIPEEAGKILKRFPVAGGLSNARWLAGRTTSPWQLFAIGSAVFLAVAYQFDRKSRLRRPMATA